MAPKADSLITLDPATHRYAWRGRTYPSVSEIIRRTGAYDHYNDIPAEYIAKAAKVGDTVHTAIFLYHLLGITFERYDPTVQPMLGAYEQFLSDTGYEVVESELMMLDPDLGFAGTLDQVGFLYGKRTIVDLKTTSSINQPAVELQTAAYEHLWTNGIVNPRYATLSRGPIAQRGVLHLKKTGRYEWVACADRTAFARFCAHLGSK